MSPGTPESALVAACASPTVATTVRSHGLEAVSIAGASLPLAADAGSRWGQGAREEDLHTP
ncbi:hypothetical protein GCM10009858_17830 [Terrabacter carboxydivorans]|uniref:Uncharacterized protein n=1 Tax=Terrabacter carboxydivorans TaxID=619730 RepID=A0ABN3LAL6_9MICO